MGFNNTKDCDISVKFDEDMHCKKQTNWLKPLAWLLSYPDCWKHHSKVFYHNMDNLKHPYLLLCTHHAFMDFKVTTKTIFPHGGTYVVAIDGFIHREGIMRQVGCISTRKFLSDTKLVRNLMYSINVLKQTAIIYPEARYSICGTTAILPPSLGKLAKLLNVPVVVLNMHGHYLNSSVWNLKDKGMPVTADMTQIVTQDEIGVISTDEINQRIHDAFQYDEYQYQLDKGLLNKDPKRCEGIEPVLYKCPHCKEEGKMEARGTILTCKACGKSYEYQENGEIKALSGETEFPHIPDWYEWERSCVREEILNGTYKIEDDVDVDSLPNSKGFINLGPGHFVHDLSGLKVTFEENNKDITFIKEPLENYSCHIEFKYNNKGDQVSFSKPNDTYYFAFKNLKNIIVKVHFGVEELYKVKLQELKDRKENN